MTGLESLGSHCPSARGWPVGPSRDAGEVIFIIQATTAWLSVSRSPDQITNLTDRLLSTRQLANVNLANIEAEC